MAKGNGNDLERLLTSVRAKVTDIHDLPGGWPGNIELALIDAVLSIRSRYGVSEETGVRGAIKRYKSDSGRASWDDLTSLAETDPDRLTAVLANKQKTGGVLKV